MGRGYEVMIILIFLVLFVIMIIMLSNAGNKAVATQVVVAGAIQSELQERERVASLLEIELFKWVKEDGFLPTHLEDGTPWNLTWDTIKKDVASFGVNDYETYVLYNNTEFWIKRAQEWMLRNSKADLTMANVIITSVKLNLVKKILRNKLGDMEFFLMEDRLKEDYRLMKKIWGDQPKWLKSSTNPINEWWENITYWLDTYEDEAACLGLTFVFWNEDNNRFAKRFTWVKKQVRERGSKEYSKIWDEAKKTISTGKPEDPEYIEQTQ